MYPIITRSTSALAVLLALCACNGNNNGNRKGAQPGSIRSEVQARVECSSIAGAGPVSADKCIALGSYVIDKWNNLYTVRDRYSDGRLEADYVGSSSVAFLNPGDYAVEVFGIEGYALTEDSGVVMDAWNNRYRVEKLFSNGKVELVYVGGSSTTFADIRDLAVSLPSYGSITPGSRVIDRWNNKYKVLETYSDGRLYAEYVGSSSTTVLKASEVSVALP